MMKQQIVAVQNSINDAFEQIEQLRRQRTLHAESCDVLKLLYLWGWNDGFVSFNADESRSALGLGEEQISRALAELKELGFIRLRMPVWGHSPIEVLFFSSGEQGRADLSWWRYYRVASFAESDES
jgi:hypothetical protein